ncbi:MAG: chemotaxis protein CheB, partial [Promethearchaeota archaeon]
MNIAENETFSKEKKIIQLKDELKQTKLSLKAIIEELQATNEALRTSEEELRLMNEELITANSDLELKIEEISKINSDINILMTSTNNATIFLDTQLAIRRFTSHS